MNIKRNDLVLIGIVLLVAIAGYIIYGVTAETSTSVLVSVNGKFYGEYSLSEDQIIEINDSNTLEIHNRKASMIEADCPDGLCIHQKYISREGESIICLPNKVIVEGSGGSNSEFDAITR